MMLLFGITGGIGTGKTAVCGFLREEGLPIIEADPLAKHLTATLPEIKDALIEKFGKAIYKPNGELNKTRMRELVFEDQGSRALINAIIHPHVFTAIQSEAARLNSVKSQSLIGVEAALIYESKMQVILDQVIVVDAPLEIRIQRIQARNQLTREQVLKRIAAQMPMAEKIELADFVIQNNRDLTHLRQETQKLYNWLGQKFNQKAQESPKSD